MPTKILNAIKKSNKKNWWMYAFLLGALNFYLILSYSQVAFGTYIFLDGDGFEIFPTVTQSITNSILSGNSPFFSWSASMGMNTSGILAAFGEVFSVTFWLSLLLPAHTALVFLLSMTIKAGLACMTFQILSVKHFNSNKLLSLIISICYGLCAFQVSMNICNPIWMDALWLLPLIIYFIHEFLENDTFLPLIICYGYLFITSFYMGYIVGIFSFLYMLCLVFSNQQYVMPAKLKNIALRYAGSVILAAGLSAFLLLPAAYFIFTHSISDALPMKALSINPLDILNQLFIGANNSADSFFPYIYCGVLCALIAPLYFVNKDVDKRTRIADGILLCIMFISCLLTPLYLFWHAFDAPDGWGFRFAFLISFLLCKFASKELKFISDLRKNILFILVPVYALLYFCMIFMQKKYNKQYQSNDIAYLFINCAFLVLITVLLIAYQKYQSDAKNLKAVSALMILIISAELILNGYASFYHNPVTRPENYTSCYNQWIDTTRDSVSLIKSIENSDFYRVGSIGDYSYNSDAYFNYAGNSDFGTMENPALKNTLKKLGVYTSPRVTLNAGYTDFANMLLGIKYEINHAPYTQYSYEMNPVNTVTPIDSFIGLGFLVNSDTAEFSLTSDNPFICMNSLASALTGESVILFDNIPQEKLSFTEEGIVLSETENGKLMTATLSGEPNYLMINVPDGGKQPYINFAFDDSSYIYYNVPLIKGGSENINFQNGYLTVSYVKPMIYQDGGYTVALEMNDSTVPTFNLPTINAATYNKETFDQLKSKLSQNKLNIIKYKNGYVHGTINCPEDNNLLFTSIPNEKGWKIYVNGSQVPVKALINDTFIGIELNKGQNDIEFKYRTPMLGIGSLISLISLLITVFLFARPSTPNSSTVPSDKKAKRKDDSLSSTVINREYSELISNNRNAIMGLAALWIFIFHSKFFYPLLDNSTYVFFMDFIRKIGFCGVDIFLFLSGIGMVRSLQRNSLKQYYINRIKRIGFSYVIITIIICLLMQWDFIKFIQLLSTYDAFAVNLYNALWFYVLIIWFYALFPVYYHFISRSKNKTVFTSVMIIIWLIIGLSVKNILRDDLWGLYNRIPVILVGVFCGFWFQEHKFTVTRKTQFILTCTLLLGIFLEYLTTTLGLEILLPISNCHFPSMILSISLCLLLATLFESMREAKIAGNINKVIGFWGLISLQFYSFQEPVLIKPKPIFLAYCSENTREITAFLVVTLLGYCLFKCQDLFLHIVSAAAKTLPSKSK